ncbi:MAG TPA: glycerophosphodiester phosphodiesterase [Bacillota bacterium]
MFTKVFAHRGASGYAPENTLPSFKRAYEMEADGIETDVHLTKDHVPVLIHDEHVRRTTNGKGWIKDLTMNELKTLDAGSWFSPEFAGTTMLTLEEFFTWIQHKPLRINLELKNNKIDYPHLEAKVYEVIEQFQLQDRIILSTFNPHSLQRLQKWFPHVERALLTSKRNKYLIQYAKELNVQALHIKYNLLAPQLVEKSHRENIAVRVFTVNRTNQMLHCLKQKCDGFFTDFPAHAVKVRKIYQ